MQFTNCTTREPLFHDPYESHGSYGSCCPGWSAVLVMICRSPLSVRQDISTTCTTRKPLFHDLYESCHAIHGSYLFDSIGQACSKSENALCTIALQSSLNCNVTCGANEYSNNSVNCL